MKKKTKKSLFSKLSTSIKAFMRKRDEEYSKRLLSKIIHHSLWMLWGTYVLAWFDKTEIAESLSKTIVTSIIAVVVGYLIKSVIENISKHTNTFGENIYPPVSVDNKEDDEDDDC